MGQLGQIAAKPSASPVEPHASAAEPALVFRADTLLCALRLAEIIETMRPLPVHRVAGAAPFLAGLSILRGQPAPVVDVALLLTGVAAPPARFISVRTGRGPVALATGAIVDVRPAMPSGHSDNAAALGPGAARLVTGVGTLAGEPLFLLRSLRLLADEVWGVMTQAGTS